MAEILNIDYNEHVNMVGTAHFTRRSINDVYEAIKTLKPNDIAIELDMKRFQRLNVACISCPEAESCKGLCEFTEATKVLGNVDANIWLIDMMEQEMRYRIMSRMTPFERAPLHFEARPMVKENPIWLWERGFKDRVINDSKRELEALRKTFPAIWSVLIDERNALMAARLAWIVSKKLSRGENPTILTFVGAAHVEGIKGLLSTPSLVKEKLRRSNLSFTKPTLIRRVAVQGD